MVNAPTRQYLTLSYIFRPRWKAFLGLDELKIYRAYGGFMGVEVPPGQYTVQFKYTPADVYWGLLLTALAFVIPFIPGRRIRHGKIPGEDQGTGMEG